MCKFLGFCILSYLLLWQLYIIINIVFLVFTSQLYITRLEAATEEHGIPFEYFWKALRAVSQYIELLITL